MLKEYPFWRDTIPSSEIAATQLENTEPATRRFDVAVVGAGYTGLSAARQLAKSGASVVVLEGGASVGAGASSVNGGQVLTGLKVDAAALVGRYGESRARALFELSLDAIASVDRLITEEQIDCEFARTGHLTAASKRSHFAALGADQALLARVFNHRVHVVPRSEQRNELGSDAYYGVLVDEHSAALNPARYVYGLARAARRKGATILVGAAVNGVARNARRWTLNTRRGPFDAGELMIATNGYTDDISPGLRRRLVAVGSYVIATAPLPPAVAASILPRGRMAFDSKHFLHYFRLTADLRLMFGGRAQFRAPGAAATTRAAAILRRDMIAVFPQLATTAIEYAWSGNVAFTRDQMPHAGMLDGRYFAAGYCGHGVAMATALGDAVARRMAGDQTPHPLMTGEWPGIPFYRGTPWFLPLVGAYYRVRDWLE